MAKIKVKGLDLIIKVLDLKEVITEGKEDIINFSLNNVELKEGNLLMGISGRGTDIKSAKKDFLNNAADKVLVLNAYGDDRKEFVIPSVY